MSALPGNALYQLLSVPVVTDQALLPGKEPEPFESWLRGEVRKHYLELRKQNLELMRAQTANGERIAALVADKAELQAEVRRLMDDLSVLYSKAAQPHPVADEPNPMEHALGHSWASARFPR